MMYCFHFFFFFSSRRRHTRWPRDWSSDVCSSDLVCSASRLFPFMIKLSFSLKPSTSCTPFSSYFFAFTKIFLSSKTSISSFSMTSFKNGLSGRKSSFFLFSLFLFVFIIVFFYFVFILYYIY